MLVNLKAALAARRLRQVDLAMRLGIPPSVFSEIINERRKADASLRARIAAELNADERWLFSSVAHIPKPASSPVVAEPSPVLACAGREG